MGSAFKKAREGGGRARGNMDMMYRRMGEGDEEGKEEEKEEEK